MGNLNMMNKKNTLTFFLLLLFISTVTGQMVPPPVPPPPPPGLPLDGGVLFLFLSGLIYGAAKLKQ
ncbi:PID-CTERM protein-sorting domain-containing protein [uncultured Polaribacter sp.]|uniref:PID-CTERM protein-sorting domain-containing protein n=1 Tax=uncultured Polaribacter sp. TaxID=174711 RepID=UPI0026208912|nr:hypothetical protein [uncultured Polaribacter sp.]